MKMFWREYTGRNDSNSKRIYKGSILQCRHGDCARVVFLNGNFVIDGPKHGTHNLLKDLEFYHNWVVIKNTSKNGRLLEKWEKTR